VTIAPFVTGVSHFIVTVSGANVVEGKAGGDGLYAARMVVAVELAPKPKAFLA